MTTPAHCFSSCTHTPPPPRDWEEDEEEEGGVITEDTGDEAQGEVRGEDGEEPGRGVQAGADLLLLQVVVQVPVVVVQQPGQLVHLDLRRRRRGGEERDSKEHGHSP